MLSLGRFSTLQHNVALQNPITNYLQFPPKSPFPCSSHLTFKVFLVKTRSGLCCNALKTKKKRGFSAKEEMLGADEFDDEDFDDVFLDAGEIEDADGGDDDEVFVPLKNMKKWAENRPRGFGEGKVYDTTVEDKLMEEIEQSRIAQTANVKKLKENPLQTTSKKDKGPEPSYDGFRVRLVNLPKKKNIHKDLRVAFQGVPGIVNIIPLVSGNEKTRDPICKGIAFVDFKNKDEAQRFMQNFSGRPICFGKVEKQIKCEMMNPKLPKPESDRSVKKSNGPSLQPILNSDEEVDAGLEIGGSLLQSAQESVSIELNNAEEMHDVSGQREEDDNDVINAISITSSDPGLADELEEGKETAIDVAFLKQTRKVKKHPKKVESRRVKANVPKLAIPGSAKKLETREKAILSGVFSKYGAAAASSTVKEESR